MFGSKNKTQSTGKITPENEGVDPRRIQTLVVPSLQKNLDEEEVMRMPIELPVNQKKQDYEIVERNFSQKESVLEKKGVNVPETSPFLNDQQEMPKDPFKEVPSSFDGQIETGLDREFKVPSEEGMKKKAPLKEFIVPQNEREVSESALTNSLTSDGFGGRKQRPTQEMAIQVRPSYSRGLFLAGFIFLIFLLVGFLVFGGYMYYKSRLETKPIEDLPIVVKDTDFSLEKNEESFSYNWKMANAIVIDEKNGKGAPIEIRKAVEELERYSGDGILEFYFIDNGKNLETVASFELVDKLGITLPKSIKALLKETGEGKIYLTKKGGDVRMVLSLETVARDSLVGKLLFFESEIIKDFSFIYLGENLQGSEKPVFHDQVYREYAIRYYNIDLGRNISLDYAFRRDTLFVSSSKDSIRDVFDMLDGKQVDL